MSPVFAWLLVQNCLDSMQILLLENAYPSALGLFMLIPLIRPAPKPARAASLRITPLFPASAPVQHSPIPTATLIVASASITARVDGSDTDWGQFDSAWRCVLITPLCWLICRAECASLSVPMRPMSSSIILLEGAFTSAPRRSSVTLCRSIYSRIILHGSAWMSALTASMPSNTPLMIPSASVCDTVPWLDPLTIMRRIVPARA